jgi:hypothetical protein
MSHNNKLIPTQMFIGETIASRTQKFAIIIDVSNYI